MGVNKMGVDEMGVDEWEHTNFWAPWGPHRDFGAPFELALLARWEVAFDTAISIMSESAKVFVEGRRVEQCFYTRTQYESVTTDKPDASHASDDEH